MVVNDRRSAISIGDMFEMQMIINHYGGTVTTGQINSGGHVQAAVVFGDGVNM